MQHKHTILTVTDQGRYVWIPPLQIIDYIDKGKQRPRYTLQLDRNQNTYLGALAKAGRDLLSRVKSVSTLHEDVEAAIEAL